MDDARVHKIHKQLLEERGFIIRNGSVEPPPGMGNFAAVEIAQKCLEEAREMVARDKTSFVTSPHWHAQNPWNDRLIYVPLDELAECMIAVDKPIMVPNGALINCTAGYVLGSWRQCGDKLDGYILTGPLLTAGVRYGPNGPDYLSPGFSLPRLYALYQKYRSPGL